jgi:hypothetical protein
MVRARVPTDANVWVELGSQKPAEAGFEARCPFSICWVLTNGAKRVKFLWINRRETGVYVASTLPGGVHESYHSDGTRHLRSQSGLDMPMGKGPALDSISGYVALRNASIDISSDLLDMSAEFQDEPLDKVIYLDNRSFGPWVYVTVYLVEPFKHAAVPLHTEYPSFIYLITHTAPWILVSMSDGSASA